MNVTNVGRIAYFAGLTDGEGYIQLMDDGKGYIKLAVRISLTDGAEVLDEMQELWGGSLHIRNRPGMRPYTEWLIYTKQAETCLRELLPFLKIKREEANLALKYRDMQNSWGRKLIGSSERKKRAEIEKRLKQLHNPT